jgi:hypothetical protein
VKPGGRSVFVCWQPLQRNPWFLIPLEAALTVIPDAVFPPPGAPGPFAFGDAERVKGILDAAGFEDAEATPVELQLDNGTVEEATVHAASSILDRFAKDASEERRAAATDAMRRAFGTVTLPDGRVALDAAAWLVTARKP